MQAAFGTLGGGAPKTNLPGTARRATELESVPPKRGLDALEALRRYWDVDAATYDHWHEHTVSSAAERAAWAAVLSRLLPKSGAKVLDVGAGTGFLSLAAARLGYDVTAVDISSRMLERLREKAAAEGLAIRVVRAPAHEPPDGTFDAVMSRQLVWLLPDGKAALQAWKAATSGPLLMFEFLWNDRDYLERARRRARGLLRRARHTAPEHHTPSPDVQAALPHTSYPSPSTFVELVEAAGWRSPQLQRLRDIEWARQLDLTPLDRLIGGLPEYVITAS